MMKKRVKFKLKKPAAPKSPASEMGVPVAAGDGAPVKPESESAPSVAPGRRKSRAMLHRSSTYSK